MKILRIILVPATMLLFAVLFFLAGIYTFSYQEMLGTFYSIPALICDTLSRPGGLAQVASAWLTQFFISPYVGAVIMAAVLTAVGGICASLVEKISGRRALAPLGVLPAVAMAFLNYNVGYSNSGTIAFLLMLCAMVLMLWVDEVKRLPLWGKALIAVALTVVLSMTVGAVAMLFGVLLCVAALARSTRRALCYLLCPIAAWLLGVVYVRCGYFGDVSKAITPEMYYTLRLKAGSFVYMPWIFAFAVIAVSDAVSLHKKPWSGKVEIAVWVVSFVGVAAYAVAGVGMFVDKTNETFKRLMYYTGRGEWDKVISLCQAMPMNNLMQQNILNMALAEEGRLGDELFNAPVYDIRSIYIEGEKNPYMRTLLSDIYYSMGHIALAQRNAFEANESLDNLSPRLLKRLVQTNIIFGAYPVAEKYIRLLESTHGYSDEMARYRTLLYNDAAVDADPQLGPKRRCLFPDNRFSAYKGLDDDLMQIARANPSHTPTIQYLGALYLLSKDIPRFASVTEEFYGADSIATPLPAAFAEGMLTAYPDKTDSIASRYSMPPQTIQKYNAMNNGGNTPPNTFWHFYKFVR